MSKELKKRWSYFIRKVYETDPLTCPKCQGEMRIISFIDQLDVIKKILQHLGLWEEAQAPPDGSPPEIILDLSYSQVIEKPPYLPVRTRRQAATEGKCPSLSWNPR